MGNCLGTERRSPNISAATSCANAASVASLTVTGYSSMYSAFAVSPWAPAMSLTRRMIVSLSLARAAGLNDRAVPRNCASSGITLSAVPAWKLPTVMTTGSNTSNCRVTRLCRAVTISQAAVIGSAARCGCDA